MIFVCKIKKGGSILKIVAITSCCTGISHTYVAAESLYLSSKNMNIDLKIETRGSVGIENALTKEDIDNCDIVLIASDTFINTQRFESKPILKVSVSEAIKNPENVLYKAINFKTIPKNNKKQKSYSLIDRFINFFKIS